MLLQNKLFKWTEWNTCKHSWNFRFYYFYVIKPSLPFAVQCKLGELKFFNEFAIGILSFREFSTDNKKEKALDLTSTKQYQIKTTENGKIDGD